jgi:NodT family efflux transporter outer membrane factor (OMF) lipoprotein
MRHTAAQRPRATMPRPWNDRCGDGGLHVKRPSGAGRRRKNLLHRWTLVANATAALAGCATPVPTSAPLGGVEVPPAWSALPAAAQAAPADAASPTWWRGFGDPQLAALVESAHDANTDVRTAQAALARARALRDAAAAALQPTLSVAASAQRARAAGGASANRVELGFDALWEPDLFGANAHAASAARADEAASRESLDGVRVSVAGEVAVAYVELRGTQTRLEVARENLAAQEQTLQIVQWRAQAGLASSLEVAQSTTAVEQTRAQLPALQASIAQTRHAIAVLTGRPPAALDAELAAAGPLPQPPASLTLELPAQALRRRPDVRAAEQQLAAAAARVAQADAQRYPALQLSASLAWSAATLGTLGGTGAARALVAGASQALFDGGARDARLSAQRAAFDSAQQTYRAAVLGALQEVEDVLAALAGAQERAHTLAAAARAAGDAALLARRRYEAGIVDYQTVLETERTLLAVQDGLAGARTDAVTQHVRLYKAVAGGWSAPAAPSAPSASAAPSASSAPAPASTTAATTAKARP